MNQRVWISDNNTDMGQPKYLEIHLSVPVPCCPPSNGNNYVQQYNKILILTENTKFMDSA
jgi:hypothetical protein